MKAYLALALACAILGASVFPEVAANTARELLQADAAAPAPEYFIEIRDGNFVNGCNNFKIAGWNQWEVVEAAAGAPSLSGASIPTGMTGPQLVRALLRRGSELGFNSMRTWVHAVNPQYALQPKAGEYSEAAFQGLDYLLDEARQANIKLILAFTSNWTPVGGIPEYLKWADATDPVDFYTNPAIIKMYQDFVETILNRKNTINGRLYKNDPTVMAWNLLNEPRCQGCPVGTVSKWFDEQATFVRSIDKNHLISTGEEGFFACCGNANNPGGESSEWASSVGQDFVGDHAGEDIDFATFHSWPDNWNAVSEEFQRNWITSHAEAAAEMGKPVILEEWGKWVNVSADATVEDRNKFMAIVFDEIKNEMSKPNSALQGSMFWQWYLEGQEGAPTEGGGPGLFGIYESDESFTSIKENIEFIQSLNGPIPGCSPADHKAAEVTPVALCESTWVDGIPGTGLEGPDCTSPINECVRGTSDCDANAACIDTDTAFECRCHYGFTGDGKTCTPDADAQEKLASLYWTEPNGLSCKAGIPVEYPEYVAGFVYDPLKSFAFYDVSGGGKFGSKTNVTLEQCMAACQVSETCESLVYNDVLMQCFLARGQCPVYNYCQGEQVKCKSTNDRGGEFEFDCGFWVAYYRLDTTAPANCEGFDPDPASVGQANPEALAAWEEWAAANPEAVMRSTPLELIEAAEAEAAAAGEETARVQASGESA